MFPEAIQFEFTKKERDQAFLLPHQQLCLRQTAHTLDFLRFTGKGSTGVICVEGINLGILRRSLMHGACTVVRCGAYGPDWARCFVSRIYPQLGWTRTRYPLAPDPNPVPEQFRQMETGFVRDLWRYDALTAFAIPRGREEKFLMQFHERHAYILDAQPGTFSSRLAQLKAANFKYGTVNRFTMFHHNPYPPFPHLDRSGYRFGAIQYEEKNLAAKSQWEVILDFRDAATQRPSIGIS